jgi:hypothetical protein
LNDGQISKPQRRTCSLRYGVPPCRGKSAGVEGEAAGGRRRRSGGEPPLYAWRFPRERRLSGLAGCVVSTHPAGYPTRGEPKAELCLTPIVRRCTRRETRRRSCERSATRRSRCWPSCWSNTPPRCDPTPPYLLILTTPSMIPTVNGNTVLSFSTHGQQSAAKGSSTTVSRSDIRLIQHLDSSAHGLVLRKLLIAYFPIHLLTTPAHPYKSIAELINPRSYA